MSTNNYIRQAVQKISLAKILVCYASCKHRNTP